MIFAKLALALLLYLSLVKLAYTQVTIDQNFFGTLLQIPMVAGLIYLVLSLEDKRQASAKAREETFVKVVDNLLGLINDLASIADNSKISSSQYKMMEKHIRDLVEKEQEIDEEHKVSWPPGSKEKR